MNLPPLKIKTFCALGALLALSRCASAPHEWSDEVALKKDLYVDRSLGERLSRQVETEIKFIKDIDSTLYLRDMAISLTEGNASLSGVPVGVYLIAPINRRQRTFALPGLRVYVSLDFIKTLETENELAAAMAIEIAHVANRDIAKRLQVDAPAREMIFGSELPGENPPLLLESIWEGPHGSLGTKGFTGQIGLLYYTKDEHLKAIEEAVKMLHYAGYDPRGVVSLWDAYLKIPDQSPFADTALNEWKTHTYKNISGFSPLRNPIVRTNEFINFMKRIKTL